MKTESSLLKIVKSNALIEACHKLSVQEQKVLLLAISKIPKDASPTDDRVYSIDAQDLSSLNGQALKNCYVELKITALSLMDKKVHIKDLPNGDGKRKKTLITCWVQSIFYVDDEGKIDLRFSKDILPYICQLKQQFSMYKIKNIGSMASSYGIRLYEMLAQYISIGHREVSIDWLRESFQLQKKYPAMKDLKKWVIEPALNDINTTSDLWVDYQQQKTGKKVTHFIFTFGLKEEPKKKKSARKKQEKIDIYSDSFLSKHARPGETKDQAIRRLKEKYST